MQTKNKNKHIPVMLHEVVSYLNPQVGESYIDMTAGYGGHASAVLSRTNGSAVLIDRDVEAVDHLKSLFPEPRVRICHQDFLTASNQLLSEGKRFGMLLADLGVSSLHLNTKSRGFAINQDGPLDMRMDQRTSLTAHTIVNSYEEAVIVDILRVYGEEPRAKRITKAIVANRPVHTTGELAKIVASTSRGRVKIHPATQVFQALRIAVNDELKLLEQSLPIWLDLLAPGGRLVVISFHSLEDRMVKRVLKEFSENKFDSTIHILTPKPVVPSAKEIVNNPRSRSAKLRAAVKK